MVKIAKLILYVISYRLLKSLPVRYHTRTRNKPSFYGQDKTDDNLSYTIDYCYKLANIPADYQQAIESPEANKWQEAMDAEMNALIGLGGKRGHADGGQHCGQQTADTQIRKFLTCPHFPF